MLLISKIQLYLDGNLTEFYQLLKKEAILYAQAPAGIELLKMVCNIYRKKAIQNRGKLFGIEGFFSKSW